MKENPILFTGPMVLAILDDRKSQTRRICRPRKANMRDITWPPLVQECPYGQPGERLWVKETYGPCDGGFCYRASELPGVKPDGGRWIPSIYMFREASRITLEITAVRVEQLQEISREDAISEGVPWCDLQNHIGDRCRQCGATIHPDSLDGGLPMHYPQDEYRKLWTSINGKGSWDKNPWVWVISFRRSA